jgi:lipopolysaccharide assembly protein B
MQASTWWLLAIPLLFALGWIAAKLDSTQLLTRTRRLPESYFQGLNFLLNDQYEQAIKAFEEVARLDPSIADLYFALGNLFRRRGETERAIRIHRNLLERADLPEYSRQKALFCLGQDYLNAGIFDHAESVFNTLANTDYALQAQRELAKLYEKESNWQAAIDALQRYQTTLNTQLINPINVIANTEGDWLNEDLSHYSCELAELYLQTGEFVQAKKSLDLAEASYPLNPRIIFYQARLVLSSTTSNIQEVVDNTVQQLDYVLSKDTKLTALALNTVLVYASSHQALTDKTLFVLKRWANNYPNYEVVKQLLPMLKNNNDIEGQLQLLHSLAYHLKSPPQRLSTIYLLLTYSLDTLYSDHAKQWQAQAIDSIDLLIKYTDKLVCKHCGFKASRHQWRCTGCGRWNTLPYNND